MEIIISTKSNVIRSKTHITQMCLIQIGENTKKLN